MKGYVYAPADPMLESIGALEAPRAAIAETDTEAYTLTPSWEEVPGPTAMRSSSTACATR